MSAYLVTGGTGFLGSEVIRRLSERGEKVYALVRSGSRERLTKELLLPHVDWIDGDITEPEVVMDPGDRDRLARDVTRVVHLAALYDLRASRRDLYLANVVGTHNMLHLAESLPRMEAFHYASTIAVAGNYGGIFTEGMFDVGQGFPDPYASTKFAAEAAVRNWKSPVARVVHRFGILVGDTRTGFIPKVDGPYYLMRLLHRASGMKGFVNGVRVVPLPFNERTRIYCVPVDVSAGALVALMDQKFEPGVHTLHLTGDSKGAPVRTVLRLMLKAYGYDVHVVPLPDWGLVRRTVGWLEIPEETLFYMNWLCRFDSSKCAERLPGFPFPFFEHYAGTLFEYARERLFAEGDKS